MTPKISVITPAHNAGDRLLQCYAGLLGQTVEDWEWIVVDNGSAASVAALLEPLGDARIQVVTLPARSSGGAARQAGLAAARGGYIAVQEPGDWSLPHRFETQLARIEGDSSIDVVGSFMYVIIPGMDVALWRSYADAMIHPTLLMRRNVAEAVPYQAADRAGEDYAFTKQVDAAYKWVFVEELLGVHSVDLGFRHYLESQRAVWRYERSRGAQLQRIIGLIARVLIFGLAGVVGQSAKLVRRRFNDLSPKQIQDYERAEAAIRATVNGLR